MELIGKISVDCFVLGNETERGRVSRLYCVSFDDVLIGNIDLKGGVMHKVSVLFVVVLLLGSVGATAQGSSAKAGVDALPPIVLSGLDAYKNKGPEQAVQAWIKGSAMEGSTNALSQANILRQVQDFYGAYRGFEVSSTRNLSPKSRIFYLVMDYEKGPLFSKFLVYQTDQGWVLISFMFNTKPEAVLPTEQ